MQWAAAQMAGAVAVVAGLPVVAETVAGAAQMGATVELEAMMAADAERSRASRFQRVASQCCWVTRSDSSTPQTPRVETRQFVPDRDRSSLTARRGRRCEAARCQ